MSSPDLVGQAMALDVSRSLSFEAVRCARGGATDRLSDLRHARSRASSSAKGYGSSPHSEESADEGERWLQNTHMQSVDPGWTTASTGWSSRPRALDQ